MPNHHGRPPKGGDEPAELARRLESARSAIAGDADEPEHRRDELVERAEARGLSRVTAEQAYDIAREEGLEPGYGLALVVESVSVQLLDGARPAVEASEPNEPEWVDAAPRPDQAERERRLRQTFRRLRARLDEAETPTRAFRNLAGDPDLEPYRY